ncbi:MAG: Rmt family 16S rRNA (guanine(1405)-N(7))-methyltransferase [Ktedonobacteraceae bacterium]|nr:Rmt family 16S rRNA (guanine(1405)-N(7))-methyltransferase [Ktedonobacteraceae bacterium]
MPEFDEVALNQLIADVLSSAKYRDVSPAFVRHIGMQELGRRRNLKEAVKETKNRLHQVSGAYLGREHYARWLAEIRQAVRSGDEHELRAACRLVMSHHASTQERLPLLDTFYRSVLADYAPIHSVLDVACGLHPLAIPWMPLAQDARYYAYDIHQDMLNFLQECMHIMGVQGEVQCCDVTQTCPQQEAEVALVLKTLPCLEQVDKLAGERLLRELRARRLVVSFPVRSLGGRKKGMAEHYEKHFYEMLGEEVGTVKKFLFETELVFVVER